jgi:hypothetical protein
MSEPRMLRPMDYGEIFNEAFDLYKRNFGLFAGIGAIVYFPWALMSVLTVRLPLVNGLISFGLYIPMVAAGGAIIKALADRYLGREATIAGSWSFVLRRLVPYLVTSLLAMLMVMGGFILLCAPGIIALFWIAFVWEVMLVEDRYFGDAIRRSRELAAGHWLRIFIVGLLAFAVNMAGAMLMGIIIAVPAAIIGGASPARPGAADVPLAVALVQGLLYGAVQTVMTPFTQVLGVLLYFDVRVRKEGFDIELLAQEMGEVPLGGGPSIAPA